ncbi:MAG: tyrosine-type recombinase/integrase [Acidimicrobiaceae bacterium]|nr:tyrosine-type recombinase/integrase [Acidimicrobiaceae bacterium]
MGTEERHVMGKLTAASVRGMKKPGKYYDQHGLILRVAPGGSRQWVWRGTVRGRRRDIGMGAVAYTTLAEARDIAYQYRKLARAGIDPRSRRASNSVPTFAEAAEQVIEAYRPGWKDTGRSEENWRSSLRRYVYPALGSTPVDEITTADLVRVLLPVWHTKAETARKLKTRLGVVLRWSIAAGYRTDDPAGPALAAALPRQTTPTRHLASLPHDQVGPTLEKLETLPRAWPPTVACLRFLAATAARSGEARFATWDEVDLETRTWTVPAERTKTNREHVVPLSAAALEALDVARLYSKAPNGSGPLFPSPGGKPLGNGAMSKITRPFEFTPHGLRASFRSWAAETGVPREVAEAALAHSGRALERAYQRSDLLAARRKVMEAWSRHIA